MANTLIYFLHLHVGEGVFLAPHKQDQGNVFHLQRLLFENFRGAVELIHGLLKVSSNQQKLAESQDGKWTSKSLVAVKEHVKTKSYLSIACIFYLKDNDFLPGYAL